MSAIDLWFAIIRHQTPVTSVLLTAVSVLALFVLLLAVVCIVHAGVTLVGDWLEDRRLRRRRAAIADELRQVVSDVQTRRRLDVVARIGR